MLWGTHGSFPPLLGALYSVNQNCIFWVIIHLYNVTVDRKHPSFAEGQIEASRSAKYGLSAHGRSAAELACDQQALLPWPPPFPLDQWLSSVGHCPAGHWVMARDIFGLGCSWHPVS